MKHFLFRLGIVLGISAGILLLLSISQRAHPTSPETEHPFAISVSAPEVKEEPRQYFEGGGLVPTGTTDRRLEFTVSITNTTREDYRDVRFELLLNPEVKPFLASQILTFQSDPMPVTTVEKAQQGPASEPLRISGFEHTWSMLLTPADDLQEYSGKRPEDLPGALRSVTVSVFWDGGSEEQIFPLQLR